MTDLKISIIIPVYNSKSFVSNCVESITNQSYKNTEIILVDDGSTDGSAEICDMLAEKDARISVIHKENGGTSDARNVGIEAASGDYITFIDNDDEWRDREALGKIADRLAKNGADIMMHDCAVHWLDTGSVNEPANRVKRELVEGKPYAEALSHVISSNVFSLYCVWAKLFKATLIKDRGIKFPKGHRSEDIAFCFDAFFAARSYDWYEEPFYVYKKGHATAQTKQAMRYELVRDLKRVYEDCFERLNDADIEPGLRNALLSYLAFPFCVWLGQSRMVKDVHIKDDIKDMKKYRGILKNDLHPSVNKAKYAVRFFGYTIASKLLALYIKKNNHL